MNKKGIAGSILILVAGLLMLLSTDSSGGLDFLARIIVAIGVSFF